MTHTLDLTGFQPKSIVRFPITRGEWGVSPQGETIDFTNYHMSVDGKPFYGICGEYHYSRMDPVRWDEQLAKMAAGGINVVSTYVFWNHHEERENEWDFTGRRNIRRFIKLCARHGLKVIVRLGPFDHGEVRNGGIPDWMYGKPYEVRSCDAGFLDKVRDLYRHIAGQIDGLYFKDGGPIIAAQLDNEYMHSSAPWEMTTGITDEWIPGGHEGFAYVHALREIAESEGISVPFYTNTGWGGSPVPDDVLPLWGGYAYRPWLFYAGPGEHPVTDEYVYRDFHANDCPRGEEFDPTYEPETKPYACCEMGGGMFSSYNYRFVLPMKSVDAMANIKMASGCNFLGYYMYQGGSNPIGNGVYLNESQLPKISYDFQAALGEFGQMRESYRRLKTLHRFALAFADRLTPLGVAVPEEQRTIDPNDMHSLRWSVRTDGRRGFVFLNNFQDHAAMDDKHGEIIAITLADGAEVVFDGIGMARDENCVLPFNMDLDGITLTAATVQPVTVISTPGSGHRTFVFMRPDGMDEAWMRFEGVGKRVIASDADITDFEVEDNGNIVSIVVVSRAWANAMTVVDDEALVFSAVPTGEWDSAESIVPAADAPAAYIADGKVKVESLDADIAVETFPADYLSSSSASFAPHVVTPVVERLSDTRYVITLPDDLMASEGVKDVRLKIRYQGDIGWLWAGATLVDDNFANGDVWEIGLREHADLLVDNRNRLVLTITPIKEGANVNVESAMAARMENVDARIAGLVSIEARAVYEAGFAIA
ncbi:beta-galactosidase [Bifidobacterium eulemuris]|uniref:Beta-galactosidase n=1 Tax=Bifidobacterium eulemuris TaxID=1765219 RepID=A0A261FZ89_9BIFI|nr:beta-galactosidase [Bifidobacterium eulemuris]OZG64066.1 beta-galactosidase [Bifidobacterium eulemuris]QOL32571.1 beta-galactosidase [Bifidobacterium eulemuris]